MDVLVIFIVLIIAALLEVAFFTLVSALFYKLFSKKQLERKQFVSVFLTLTAVDFVIGIAGFLNQAVKGIPAWVFIFYCICMLSIGMLRFYHSASTNHS